MSQKEKASQWINQAINLSQETDRQELLPILNRAANEISGDVLPPILNRATGLLAPYIYQYPLEGKLGELIERIYYFFQLLPDGYSWSWKDIGMSEPEVSTELNVLQAYIVNDLEVISVGIDSKPRVINSKQKARYDDTLFNIESILAKIADNWYVLYDANLNEYIPDAVSDRNEVIKLLETADADVRLCKLDYNDPDLMWALVQEYELSDGIALFHFNRLEPQKLKTWLLSSYTELYDKGLEINDIIRPGSLAEMLGETDFSSQIHDLFSIVKIIALRFETGSNEFVLYRKQAIS